MARVILVLIMIECATLILVSTMAIDDDIPTEGILVFWIGVMVSMVIVVA